ncbi:MAG: DUF4251 domain-containing protein [Bacteroidales bacterium]|nr:DUF4251 domain-containing protein [Bacteroidales bacterium]MBP3269584.1 DUF4251 domain-containing protein [Bacteroidales bacterium]
MKQVLAIALAFAAIIMSGCASLKMTPEEKAAQAAKIQEDLDNRTFLVDVDQMIPRRGGAKHVTNFSLEVDGDRLISRLPYFGQAWNIPYGGGKGMNFESTISDYIESFPKPDRRQITLATNNGEDTYVFVIQVFTSGKVDIDVRSRNREPISYYGTIVTDRKDQSDK